MAEEVTLTIEREFSASPERVFEAWVNPDSSVGWWGPKDLELLSYESDPRLGGAYRLAMKAPDGEVHINGGRYTGFVPGKLLAMTHAWENAEGQLGHETQITVTLTALPGGRTRMLFVQTGFDNLESRDGHGEGWGEAFDDLDGALQRASAA